MTVLPSPAPPTVLVAHPSADRYGSDRMLLESVIGMVESGWRVAVTLPEDGPLADALRAEGVPVLRSRTPRLSRAAMRPAGLVRMLRDLVAGTWTGSRLLRTLRPDVAYVSTVTVPWWAVLARLLRIPVVTHVHEAEPSAPRAVRLALAAPLLLSSRVIANSAFAAAALVVVAPRVAGRLEVVTNGVVGPDSVTPARDSIGDRCRLLYVGRLSRRKGVDVAVRAVDLLRRRGVDVSLEVVGDVFPGYEWYETELVELVETLGLSERVHLLGFRTPVWPFIEAADVVVVPSRTDEPFGNTAVEAVLSARPVVASRSGGLAEAVGGFDSARTVEPGDPGALADAVEDVLRCWAEVRCAAVEDAATALDRHDPRRYRGRVAAVVSAAAGRAP